MSSKEDTIAKYGEKAYNKRLVQTRRWITNNHARQMATLKEWRTNNQEKVDAVNRESSRKGGKYYVKKLISLHTGIAGERHKIRMKHGNRWRPYKRIIAPDSQCHHQWVPDTAEYTGLALVEANQHRHGFIKVIRILEGKITLYTEKEIREQETKNTRG